MAITIGEQLLQGLLADYTGKYLMEREHTDIEAEEKTVLRIGRFYKRLIITTFRNTECNKTNYNLITIKSVQVISGYS